MPPSTAAASTPFLTPALSVYLDLVRFLAAFAVLAAHLEQDGVAAGWLPLSTLSHEAVIVFFVISGLVIATTVQRRETDWCTYTIARVVRIYSVVIPAIVLSFVVVAIALLLDPDLWQSRDAAHFSVVDIFSSLLFLNESWSLNLSLPWNAPYWSLCYEVWYYVLFGIMVFAPKRSRLLWIAVCAVITGPAMLVLFPLWLIGAGLARLKRVPTLSTATAAITVLGTWIIVWAISTGGVDIAVQHWLHDNVPAFWRLESSQRLVTDYVMALLVVANFIAFRSLPGAWTEWMMRWKKPIRFMAGFTFSIYLFHRPLTQFVGHFMGDGAESPIQVLLILAVILGICVVLGHFTESRKYVLRAWAERLFVKRASVEG